MPGLGASPFLRARTPLREKPGVPGGVAEEVRRNAVIETGVLAKPKSASAGAAEGRVHGLIGRD